MNNDELRKHYTSLLEGDVSLVPSDGMQSAAKRGLELYKAGRGGDGLVPATIKDAHKMAAGQALSESKVRRMRAWFARHYVDKKPGWSDSGKETPGYVAHLLWGGDAGKSWSESKVRQLDNTSKMQEGGESLSIDIQEARVVSQERGVATNSEMRNKEFNPFPVRGTGLDGSAT